MIADWTVQSSAAAAILLALTWAVRRRSAALREALLIIALAKFLVPPALIPFGLLPSLLADSSVTSPGPATAPASNGFPWLGLLWFAGALFVGATSVGQYLRLRAALRGAPSAGTRVLERATELARALGARWTPVVQHSSRVSAPIAAGVWRRRIVIPTALLASLSPDELDAILLHELAHHRRRHLALGWIRVTACAVWWWNPLVWLVARALRHAHEEVCDDLVVQRSGMAADRYCDVLVHAASVAAAPAGAAAFAQRLHPLGRRVKRLLEDAPAAAEPRWLLATTIPIACLVLPGAAAATRPPQTAAAMRSADVRLASAPTEPTPTPSPSPAPRSRAAIAPAVPVEPPASGEPPAAAPAGPTLSSLLSLGGLPEVFFEIPAAISEARESVTDNVRTVIDEATRSRNASDADVRRTQIRIVNKHVVRDANKSILRALNPLNWFTSGSSSPSPSPSSSPSPSPSPSPSKHSR